VVVLNHVKAHENKLGSDWLKELASQSSPSPPPGNHGNADNDDDSVLLGDTIIVAPPIEQQIPAEDEATAATDAADDYASDDPAVQEPTTQVRKRRKDYGPPTRHSDRLRGATESPAGPSVGSSAGLPAGPLTGPPTGPPAALLVQQQTPQTYEPSNIKEALTGPHQDKWRAAIVEEMRSLRKNHTWDLVKRPKDWEIVSCKWVFKIKSSGRHKARLVARGFSQVYGQDYFETYAPVARLTSI